MPRRLQRGDLVSSQAEWLLTLTWAGQIYRLSSRPLEVTSTSARTTDTLSFAGGLGAIEVEQTLAVLSDSPDLRSVALEVILPVDVAELIADGHDLAAATGELALWLEGTTWEERLVVVAGRVSEPEYGGDGEPIAFSLVEEPYDDVAVIPPPSLVVNETTWPDAAEAAVGCAYPIVWGRPGLYGHPDGTTAHVAGSPALPVVFGTSTADYVDTLLVTGHPIESTQVAIWFPVTDAQGQVEGPFTAVLSADGLGQPCVTVDVSGATTDLRTAGRWWACWSYGDAMSSPYSTGALTTFAELLRYLVDRSSLAWDRGRLEVALGRLQQRTDGYIDEPVSPWAWVVDNLIPLLPVSVSAEDGGLTLVVWRHDATKADAIDRLEVEPGISRVGRVRYDRPPREIVNEWRIRFATHADHGDQRKTLISTPERDPDNPDQITSTIARSSALRYGTKRSGEVVTDVVWSDVTAAWIAAWRTMAHGFAARLVQYDLPQERAWWDLGDVVLLTDAELWLDDAIGLVQAVELSDVGRVMVTLQILDDVLTRVLDGSSTRIPTWNGGN